MNHSGGQVAKKRDNKESNKMTRSVQQQQPPVASQSNIKPAVTDPSAAGAKRQPTAEEKRLAEILHGTVDGEARKKMIEQVQDITGCTTDEVVVALHDCNDDMERAVTALLERDQNEDEDAWEHAGKKQEKKKKTQPFGKQNGNDSNFQGSQRERDGNREDRKPSERRDKRDRSDGPPRPRRDRAPRFQRGDAARNNGEEQADANGEDNESRSRSRRGRGGESAHSDCDSSSSRGRSAGGRSFRNSGGQGFGTWENTDNSESKATEDGKQASSWGEITEDWDAAAEDWTGTLTESKVFTASSARDDSSKPYAGVNGGDSNLFNSAQTAPGQAFASTADSLSGYQQQQQFHDLQGTAGQGQLGQRIHLSDLMGSSGVGDNNAYLRTGQAPGAGQQYTSAHLPGHFPNQFNKQAEDSIKASVGIGGVVGRNTPDQADQQANSDSQQRAKAKSRLPPPSKIPTTAVVMPGGSTQLDVNCEFGFWDASGDATFGNTGSGMKLHSGGSSVLSQLQGLDGGVASTASHDQTRTSHYPTPSHTDAYSSAAQAQGSYGQQRSALPAATVAATSSAKASPMFSASDFSSSYQQSSYKVGPSTGYNVSSSNLSSAASYQPDYSAAGAGASSASQLTMPSYLSGASSQSVSQSNSVVGSGVFSASSQAPAPGANSKMYSGSSYANDYHAQQLTNNYGGQSGLSYDSQSYQGQQSGLGYQSSAGSYSSAKQQAFSGASSTSSASGMNLLSASTAANNMADGFAKLGLKDASQSGGLDLQQQQHYGVRSPVADSSATSASASSSAGNVHVDSIRSAASSSAGAASVTSSAAASTAASRSASSTAAAATKVPVTAGPSSSAVPMMQYGLVGQTGMQGIPHALLPTVQQIYPDDYALLQPRTMMANYYDMSAYQQPSTTLAGRDQSSIATVLPYTVDTKSGGRVDDNSPGNLSSNQQQQQQLAAHQQAYLNPTIPPGYNTVFYPSNMITAGGYYNPAMFQLPAATNTAAGVHLGSASGAQLPKYYTPSATGYGDVSQQTQVQDYSKMYMAAAQSQTKAPTVGMTSDLTAASYGKPHSQTYEKSAYGTSPPYNLPMGQGAQAVTMAAPAATAYRAQYGMPVMQHSQMVPHMQQQDMRGGQQLTGSQMKAGGKYNATQYWTGN